MIPSGMEINLKVIADEQVDIDDLYSRLGDWSRYSKGNVNWELVE